MELKTMIETWLLACRANGLAEQTIHQREMCMRVFTRQFDGDWKNVNDLRLYVVWLRAHYNGHTPNDHVRVLKSFFSWCEEEYDIPNPTTRIKTPKPPPAQVRAFDAADFVKVFNATMPNIAGIRDRALLSLFADTGARLGGITRLRIGDLNLERRFAIVSEKNNRARRVHFTQLTLVLVTHWLDVRRNVDHDSLWHSMNDNNPLTVWGVMQILKRLKRRAGVSGRMNAHSFRHAFARSYLLNGGDLVTLSRLLGHKRIDTTATIYAIFSQSELSMMHERHSPIVDLLKNQP